MAAGRRLVLRWPSMATERNRALVQLFLREISENRARVAFDLVAPAARITDLSRGLVSGRDDERERFHRLRVAFPDLSIGDVRTVSENSKIGVAYVLRGTHRGPYQGIAPTGRPVETRCAALVRVADARIAEMSSVLEGRSVLRQIGVLASSAAGPSERPPPPEPEPAAVTSTFSPVTRETVRRFYADVVGRGDRAALDEITAPDVLDDPPPPLARSTGREGLHHNLEMWRGALDGWRVEVHDVLVQGENAFAHVSYSGHSRGELLGFPATGRRIAWSALELFDVGGARIRSRQPMLDALALVSQIGDPSTRHAGTLRLSVIGDDD